MKLRFTTLMLLAFLLTAGLATAAISSVSLTRTVSAGSVVSDTDTNAVIRFTVGTGYTSVVSVSANGVVSINLAQSASFNPSATFTIGTEAAPVFTITNNSAATISVALTSPTGGLTLVGDNTIASGQSASYRFSITTTTSGTTIGGTLSITE